jgi:hypothetical protein
VLRAVPVEARHLDQHDRLRQLLPPRRGERGHQRRILHDPRAAEQLEPPPPCMVEEEQRDPVIARQVARRDVLAVAAELGEADRPRVERADEARRPAAVLDVGPPRL